MILDLLKKRYSCRDFSDKEIPVDIIRYMLECGRLSASGGNDQPWKFGVITDTKIIAQIADAAGVNYSQAWVAKAPLLIALCTKQFEYNEENTWESIHTVGINRFPSMRDKLKAIDNDLYAAVNMEEHQTKIPGEHMVLAALEHGVYSTWISSIDCEMTARIIGAEGYLVSNVIAFGYPAQQKGTTPKKELRSITFTNHFTNEGFS